MTDDKPLNPSESENVNNLSSTPKQRFESIFEKFEMMAMQQGGSGVNINSLNEKQKINYGFF